MTGLKVENKNIVVPGDVLAEGIDFLPSYGTYRMDDKIIASRLGIVSIDRNLIRIIPLTGKYLPKKGDTIIGKVIDITLGGWRLEINSPYTAMLSLRDATFDYIEKGADLTEYFDINEYVVAKITNVTTQKLVDLTTKIPGVKKLRGGRIIKVNTNKVPRIIGKQGSMVSMIKKYTGCHIIVGQNGLIWVKGHDIAKENLAIFTIKKIERESHMSGLTDTIESYLKNHSVADSNKKEDNNKERNNKESKDENKDETNDKDNESKDSKSN